MKTMKLPAQPIYMQDGWKCINEAGETLNDAQYMFSVKLANKLTGRQWHFDADWNLTYGTLHIPLKGRKPSDIKAEILESGNGGK